MMLGYRDPGLNDKMEPVQGLFRRGACTENTLALAKRIQS